MGHLLVFMLQFLVLTGGVMADIGTTIRQINPKVSKTHAEYYASAIRFYSHQHGLDPYLVAAIVAKESSFNYRARGKSGEIGLMQLHPRYHGLGLQEWVLTGFTTNINIGTRYLRTLRDTFDGQYVGFKWIEHYNRGPNCKTPKKFPYTTAVMKFYDQFKRGQDERPKAGAVQLPKRKPRQDG